MELFLPFFLTLLVSSNGISFYAFTIITSKDTEKFKAKHSSKSSTNIELMPINNAHVNKQSSTLNSNLQSGKITLNNNKNGKETEKNVGILTVGANGAGINNFANFDAFSSTNFDPFESDSTHNTVSKTISSKTTNDTTDGLLNSLSFLSTPPSKRGTLTNETRQNTKNQYFDAKFTSFVTNDRSNKKADESNANTKSQNILQTHGGAEGFADFNKISSTFETAFQSCGALDANLNITYKPNCDTTRDEAEKIPSKFLNECSKNDEFDADLQEALKNSLIYQ